MFNQIKSLLSNTQLLQQIKHADSVSEVISLLHISGTQKGMALSKDKLDELIHMQNDDICLNESELLLVSGGVGGSLPGMTATCNTGHTCNC